MRLIDADALLEMVDKERQYLIARGQKGAEHILVHNFRDLIDNAPTVDNNEYNHGFMDALIMVGKECDGHKAGYSAGQHDARPQGEWIGGEHGYL